LAVWCKTEARLLMITTESPDIANDRAIALPMPAPPPDTTTVRFIIT